MLPEMLLSVAQVAERLGVNRATAYGLIARGELPAARVGTVLRILPTDLEANVRRSPSAL